MTCLAKRTVGLTGAVAFILTASAALATQATVSCGALVSDVIRTQDASLTFSNTNFVSLANSSVSVNVPAGTTRCVKVLFTAEAGATHFCYVRAMDNGVPMNPNGNGAQTLISHYVNSANANSFLWARRVGPGSHVISIQRRVSGGTCTIDDWTVDVEVHQ